MSHRVKPNNDLIVNHREKMYNNLITTIREKSSLMHYMYPGVKLNNNPTLAVLKKLQMDGLNAEANGARDLIAGTIEMDRSNRAMHRRGGEFFFGFVVYRCGGWTWGEFFIGIFVYCWDGWGHRDDFFLGVITEDKVVNGKRGGQSESRNAETQNVAVQHGSTTQSMPMCPPNSYGGGFAWGPELFGPNRTRAAYDDDIVLESERGRHQHRDDTPGGDFPDNTALTTTTSTAWDDEDEEEEVNFMQMRNTEQADLRQLRMPEPQLQRLENLLDGLADHQEAGRGPNARWALACIVRRTYHIQDLLELYIRVLQRRLQPQGYWPIVRVPRQRSHANHIYNWARQFGTVLRQSLEECLQLPLDTNDFEEADQLQHTVSTSSEVLDSGSSFTSGPMGDADSRCTRSRSRSPSSRRPTTTRRSTRQASSSLTLNSEESVSEDRHHILIDPNELMGIWREYVDPDEGTTTGVVSAATGSNDPIVASGPTNGVMDDLRVASADEDGDVCHAEDAPADVPSGEEVDDVGGDEVSGMQLSVVGSSFSWTTTSTTWAMSLYANEVICTTTTTSTTTVTSRSGMDSVRDAVNEQLVQGGVADTREVLRRLVARLRHLRRLQGLVEEAIVECLQWVPVSLRLRPWNARLQERIIWQQIMAVGAQDEDLQPAPVDVDDFAHVLMQPNLPGPEVMGDMMPHIPQAMWGALRRRLWNLWRSHVQGYGQALAPQTASSSTTLYLVQADDDTLVNTTGLEEEVPLDYWEAMTRTGTVNNETSNVYIVDIVNIVHILNHVEYMKSIAVLKAVMNDVAEEPQTRLN
ncbi:unnamed protein product [Symbiodinium sp. CCMP2592]|nr:unnamed protein product [Symbiodinium sp. CCMP2592]